MLDGRVIDRVVLECVVCADRYDFEQHLRRGVVRFGLAKEQRRGPYFRLAEFFRDLSESQPRVNLPRQKRGAVSWERAGHYRWDSRECCVGLNV